MLSVYFRSFAKIGVFIFCVFFIVFFIVYGYRFNRNIGFIQKNVYVEFKFWSKNQTIHFGGDFYTTEDNYLKLYNIESGCYNITYYKYRYKECFEENKFFHDIFVIPGEDKILGKDYQGKVDNIDYLTFGGSAIKGRDFSSPIQNAFRYNEISFVQDDNKLFACSDDFLVCKYVKDVYGDPVGGVEEGIIYYDEQNGYKLVGLK